MKVELGTLKEKGEDLAAFLEPRVGTKPSVSADSLEIEDESVRQGVKPRHVKTYIKRFMFMNGLRKKYRVFVAGKELTIQEIVTGEEKEEEKEKAQKKSQAEKMEREGEKGEARAKEESAPEGEEGAPAGKPAKAEKPKAPKKSSPKKKKPKAEEPEPEKAES